MKTSSEIKIKKFLLAQMGFEPTIKVGGEVLY